MADDYKNEFLTRLHKSEIYNTLKRKCTEKDSEVIGLVDSAVSYSVQRTKTIIKNMGEFTLHDSDHLFKVLHLMEKLLPEATLKNFSPPELMLLILTAFFHDIGMAPDEAEVLTWRKIWDVSPIINPEEQKTFYEFKKFYSARLEEHETLIQLIEKGDNSTANILKSYLITEFIRKTHAQRATEIIEKDWKDKIVFRDTELTVEFAQLCLSHNEDALTLLDFDKNLLCGEKIVACLPLIGVILRLADILDFDAKRTPSILYSHLYVRHPVSLKEWKKHRSVEAWEINPEIIQYSTKCKHPAIEASIHEFCNIIDKELSVCNNIISSINDFNKNLGREISIKFPLKVNREKIKAEKDLHGKPKYIYHDTKFNLSKRQVIDLLMGTKLYGNPEVALRELLQNSIDACLLRQAQETKWGNPYYPVITVKYHTEGNDNILEVDDNGTGMDEYIIDNYYSRVGSSFYTSIDFFNLQFETNSDFVPTSRFGIGILSCFMVADTLIVDTKRITAPYKSSTSLNITVEGQESIFWITEGKREVPGTTTKLILRPARNPWQKMTEEQFIASVENVITNPPFKINIQTKSQIKVRDENSFKEITATSLKDYTWNDDDNIRVFEITLNQTNTGIVGSAIVPILEWNKKPTESIKLNTRDVEIEGNTYRLEREIKMSADAIREYSKTITINDAGEIEEANSTQERTRSNSRISLHGIEIPTTLFPRSWELKKNQVQLNWPFPLIVVVDIYGKRDLDLNSSRTEIIVSDKWIDFEEELAYQIYNGIAQSVSNTYWKKFKYFMSKRTKNEGFIKGINRVAK